MMEAEEMNGFPVPGRALPSPPVDAGAGTRLTLTRLLMAMVCGATPEESAGYLEDGFPAHVLEALGRPLEAVEMGGHLDLLLAVSQSPAMAAV